MKHFKNPVIPAAADGHTADPYVIRHKEKYYHCYCRRDGVYITKADKLCDISWGEEIHAFAAPQCGKMSAWYAPELHRIGGKWYIYAAPAIDEKEHIHCMCVLERQSEEPFGKYEYKGMIKGLENTWCIDGTVFEHQGKHYLIWTTCSQMYMSMLKSPFEITGKITALAHPEYAFETKRGCVNEGPALLKRNGKIHIIYSANDSKTDDYCLGRITYCGGDILDEKNWVKEKKPVFEKTDTVFGPGHCSFTTVSENNKENDWIVYHANLVSGSGWRGRSVWIQPFGWNENDEPVFGKPEVNLSEEKSD